MFAAVPFEQKAVAPRLPDGVLHDPNGPAVSICVLQAGWVPRTSPENYPATTGQRMVWISLCL